MPRFQPTLALALLGLLVWGAPAAAHELTVLDPGSAQLDLGDATLPRLVHGTLVAPADAIELSVAASTLPREVLLLVPDEQPEASADVDALPTISAADRDPSDEGEDALVDEVTGVAYRIVAREPLGAGASLLTVERGSEPTRVAMLVADPDAEFAAFDVARTPSTLLRLRGWADTPAAGSRPVEAPEAGEFAARTPWYGAAIALVALVTAGWWLRSGRARARHRGIERSRSQD